MVREFRNLYVFMDSVIGEAITHQSLSSRKSASKLQEWICRYPMPDNAMYENPYEAIDDLYYSTGAITLPGDSSPDFVQWMEDLINFLSGD